MTPVTAGQLGFLPFVRRNVVCLTASWPCQLVLGIPSLVES